MNCRSSPELRARRCVNLWKRVRSSCHGR
jgi:hypothetical protein